MSGALEDHVLHAGTWLVVRALPWSSALRVVTTIARAIPVFASNEEARQSLQRLRGGTCLTRALVTSARLPGSEVTFGVRRGGGRVLAHAWVTVASAEDEGARTPLIATDPAGDVISAVDLAAISR